jgi:hypothetical protein
LLKMYPALKAELLPKLTQFRPTLPRAPPSIAAPVGPVAAVSWSQAVLPLGRA